MIGIAFTWLLGRLGALWGAVSRNPWPSAVIALCALSAWLWHGKRWALEEIAAIHAAQKGATAAQVAVNHEPARKSGEIARKSDAEAPAYYEQGRRAGAAYADVHRVPRSCAPGAADLPGTNIPAAVHDGAGGNADMVAISRPDFDTCTANSTRLAKVRQDAESLIADGVATPTRDEPGNAPTP